MKNKKGLLHYIDNHTRHLTYAQVHVAKTEGTYKNFFIILSEVF